MGTKMAQKQKKKKKKGRTVRAVTGLVAHQCVVALFRLDDCGGLEIELVPAVDDFVKFGDAVVVAGQVHVAAFLAVAVGVERVGLAILVVGEHAEILGPVAKRSGGVDEGVRAGDGVGRREALEQPAVRRVVRMPPHLQRVLDQLEVSRNAAFNYSRGTGSGSRCMPPWAAE